MRLYLVVTSKDTDQVRYHFLLEGIPLRHIVLQLCIGIVPQHGEGSLTICSLDEVIL